MSLVVLEDVIAQLLSAREELELALLRAKSARQDVVKRKRIRERTCNELWDELKAS